MKDIDLEKIIKEIRAVRKDKGLNKQCLSLKQLLDKLEAPSSDGIADTPAEE